MLPGPPSPAVPAAATMPGANRGIFLIAVFDLVKAVLFLVAAAGMFHLVNRNTQVELTRLLHVFRLSGDHALIKNLLLKANVISDPSKRIFSEVLLLYAVLYAVEGVGLLLRQRWAEYFAVAMTAIPLPFEAHTLVHHATRLPAAQLVPADQQVPRLFHDHLFMPKVAVLLINVAIVWFLSYHLRRSGKHGPAAGTPPSLSGL